MIRQAIPGDEAALEAHLARHSATTMFLRGNLAAHGLGQADHPHATAYFLCPASGPIRAVLGLTQSGMILCQCADAPEALPLFAKVLQGRRISGLSGEAAQTSVFMNLLGLTPAEFGVMHVEPLFQLALADLSQENDPIRRARAEDTDLLMTWFAAYMTETGLGQGDPALGIAEAKDRVQAALNGGSLRLLIDPADRPLAMAALNARAGASVQVGGVYVPPDARGQGLARKVTRALLAEARASGAREAILFSNNDAASRAYRSIGFEQVGQYRIAFLHSPRQVPA